VQKIVPGLRAPLFSELVRPSEMLASGAASIIRRIAPIQHYFLDSFAIMAAGNSLIYFNSGSPSKMR
jgi:hypothetical protein